jgi:serine/threonine protein phosphatase PrpC
MAQLMTNHSLWQVVDVKVRGSSHERTGLPCQDAYGWDWIQEGKSLIVAVSDGAGSAKFSEKGSQLAAEKVVTHLLQNPALSHLTEESQW